MEVSKYNQMMAYLTRPAWFRWTRKYGGERAIPRKTIDGRGIWNFNGKNLSWRVKVGDETKFFSDSFGKSKKMEKKNSAIARKKGYGKRDMSLAGTN